MQDESVASAAGEDAPLPPEAVAVVEEFIPGPAELAVIDPQERTDVLLAMDEHDVRMLLERVQSSALRKWVYVLPDGTKGLTVHAVQDITQTMNWTGKCRIGVLPETLKVERATEDAGNGPEPFWTATIFARDEVTGQTQSGVSTEPVRMRLRQSTADRKRKAGAKIPEDNTVFDPFALTKAVNKAERNAQAKFIPEQIEQTIIAMFEKDPARVERIQTDQEQRIAELPPPLDDEVARGLLADARAAYNEIVWPEARVEFPPGQFGAWVMQAQHSHEMLRNLVAYVEQRRDELAAKYGGAS